MPLMSNIFPWEENQEGVDTQQPVQQDPDGSKLEEQNSMRSAIDISIANDKFQQKQQKESIPEEGATAKLKPNNLDGQTKQPSHLTGIENTSLEASTADTAPTTASVSNLQGNNNHQQQTKSPTQSPGTVQLFPRARSHSPVKRGTATTSTSTSTMDIVGNSSNSSIRSISKHKNLVSHNTKPLSPTRKINRKMPSTTNFIAPVSPRKESAIANSSHNMTCNNAPVTNASTHRNGVSGFLSNAFRRSSHGGR
jgi:hypothetical protein